jgi:hypothetical protein
MDVGHTVRDFSLHDYFPVDWFRACSIPTLSGWGSVCLFEQDLFRKPASTFRDHAPGDIGRLRAGYRTFDSSASSPRKPTKNMLVISRSGPRDEHEQPGGHGFSLWQAGCEGVL